MTIKQYFGNSTILLSLIAANIGLALLIWVSGLISPRAEMLMQSALVIPSIFSSWLSQPWSLVTYMFTQISFLHLLFNMLWLLWFGRIFLFCSSEKRLLLTYLGGGLTGGIFYLLASNIGDPVPGGYLIGSSAAVLAVMTAASIMAPNLELRLLLLGEIRLKYVALICILLTFLGIGGGNAGGFSAHIGGVLFGLFAPSLFRSSGVKIFSTVSDTFRNIRKKMKARKRIVPDVLLKPGEAQRNRKILSSLTTPH
ncbi:MAG: rhomboid family intramembrane serine protease, partial [Muribaculaceae bacterium]|nr:rhomboid family intramembrane serine protease [Muribaculaceae bacterium]